MDEQTAFETRAVLAPRRARRSRLALLLPVMALVAITWAGLSGTSPERATDALAGDTDALAGDTVASAVASVPGSTAMPPPQVAAQPDFPTDALGLPVHRLHDVQLARLTRNDVIAIAGWYVPLAITDCPDVTPAVGDTSIQIRPGRDPWAFCERSGVLHAWRPDGEGMSQRIGPDAEDAAIGPSSVDASLVIGIRLPLELERVGADPMPIVVLGHFVETSTACMLLGACPSELVVDHVAWTPST